MVDPNEVKRKPGAVTVLALLVSFLFAATPAANAAPQSRAQLGQTELVKRGPPLRTSIRSQNDDADADSALLPPAPAIVTEAISARPAAPLWSSAGLSAPRLVFTAYRARAPPVA